MKEHKQISLESIRIGITNESKKLKGILRDLEQLKEQKPQEDLRTFHDKIELLKNHIRKEVESVLQELNLGHPFVLAENETININSEVQPDVATAIQTLDDNIDLASELAAKNVVYHNWERLRSDLSCLNEMFISLASTVKVWFSFLFSQINHLPRTKGKPSKMWIAQFKRLVIKSDTVQEYFKR